MAELYFTEDHEWMSIEGDIATIGITDYAQQQLGDLVFVELPEIDATVVKGDSVVVVESVKAASDVFSPVDGTIIAVNDQLSTAPSLVNSQPESDGWLWKMKLTQLGQLETLLNRDAYKKLIG